MFFFTDERDEKGPNYSIEPAMAVIEKFGFPTHQPSIGIPTVCRHSIDLFFFSI
jgi:hypothetical protein